MATPRSKTPLILIMAGGLAFALGYRIVGLVLVGLGGALFAIGFGGSRASQGGVDEE